MIILSLLFTKEITTLTFDYFSFKSLTKINLLPFDVYDDHGHIDNEFAITLVTKNSRFMSAIVELDQITESNTMTQTNGRNETINYDKYYNFYNFTFDINNDDDDDQTTYPDKCDEIYN